MYLHLNTHLEVRILFASVRGSSFHVLFAAIASSSVLIAAFQDSAFSPLVAALTLSIPSRSTDERAVVSTHSDGALRSLMDLLEPAMNFVAVTRMLEVSGVRLVRE